MRCPYFKAGICTANPELESLRGDDCANTTKNACCYVCKLKDNCEISCDFMNHLDMPSDLEQPTAMGVHGGSHLRIHQVTDVIVIILAGFPLALFGPRLIRVIDLEWRLLRLTKNPEGLGYLLAPLFLLVLLVSGVLLGTLDLMHLSHNEKRERIVQKRASAETELRQSRSISPYIEPEEDLYPLGDDDESKTILQELLQWLRNQKKRK